MQQPPLALLKDIKNNARDPVTVLKPSILEYLQSFLLSNCLGTLGRAASNIRAY